MNLKQHNKNKALHHHLLHPPLRPLRFRPLNRRIKVEKNVKVNDYYMIIFKCHFLKV